MPVLKSVSTTGELAALFLRNR